MITCDILDGANACLSILKNKWHYKWLFRSTDWTVLLHEKQQGTMSLFRVKRISQKLYLRRGSLWSLLLKRRILSDLTLQIAPAHKPFHLITRLLWNLPYNQILFKRKRKDILWNVFCHDIVLRKVQRVGCYNSKINVAILIMPIKVYLSKPLDSV